MMPKGPMRRGVGGDSTGLLSKTDVWRLGGKGFRSGTRYDDRVAGHSLAAAATDEVVVSGAESVV